MAREIAQIGLFDMDGTLCDHDRKLQEDYELIKSPNDPILNSFDDDAPEYIQKRKRLIRSQPGWWSKLSKLQLGFDVLKIAQELGFHINILTKGPGSSTNAWSEKKDWVEKHIGKVGIDINLSIVSDKSTTYGKFLVDDYPEYLKSWLNSRPRGIGIMPAQDWNKDFVHERVLRYDGQNLEQVKQALEWARDRKGQMPKFN